MKLIVKNFGAIKDLSIELKPLMLFIGQQGTGKSTLAKLITIFKGKFLANQNDFIEALKHYNIDFALNTKTYIHFEDSDYTYIYESNVFSSEAITVELPSTDKELMEELSVFLKKTFSLAEENELGIGQLLEMVAEKISFERNIYVPAERILIANISEFLFEFVTKKIDFPKCILDFGAKYAKARRELTSITVNFLDSVKYNYTNNTDQITVKGNKKLKLSQSSSGIQSSVPLALVVEHFSKQNNVLFTVEEPELNLFPSAQKRLVHFLTEYCLKEQNQLIITTHSPYIITSFANLIQADTTAKLKPELQEEVEKIIPKTQWIDFEKVGAYYFNEKTGKLVDILDYENKTINGNAIDDVSETIGNEFEQLMKLKYHDL